MEDSEYARLFHFEDRYWWYRGLRAILLAELARHATPETRYLDAGCGTGGNLAAALRSIGPGGCGIDYAAPAMPFWRQRALRSMARASINELPFADASFDLVYSIDVLECDAVDPGRAVDEMLRVLRPGGTLVLVVPAYDFLMNRRHHRAVHASRRYTRGRVRALLDTRPCRLVRATHLFMLLFPLVAAVRLLQPWWSDPAAQESDMSDLPGPLNALLAGIVAFEGRLVRRLDLPFGSSILAVARKHG